jgi:hypothetical protein
MIRRNSTGLFLILTTHRNPPMKKQFLLFFLLLFAFQTVAQQVYVTKSGKKYHAEGCRYLRKSAYPMTLGDAMASGYTACSVCAPGGGTNSNSTLQRTHRKSTRVTGTQCEGITKKGTRCKRRARPGTTFCWQHG